MVVRCRTHVAKRIVKRRNVITQLEHFSGYIPTSGWMVRLKANQRKDLELLGIVNGFVSRLYECVRRREEDLVLWVTNVVGFGYEHVAMNLTRPRLAAATIKNTYRFRFGSFWLGDVDFLQCYSKVENIIARDIGEPILNNKEQHVLDVVDTKSWEVAFLECVKVVIGSSYFNLSDAHTHVFALPRPESLPEYV
ncbi:hypothetical protein Tco_0469322 [Tanacetum coccineum]